MWAIITSCWNTELMSRPCHSSSGAWKSNNISVQLAVCYSCCSVFVCPKKQWMVSLKAATAHRTVSLSLCTGHCCSWGQLSSAWQWKFCVLMYPETCMYVSPKRRQLVYSPPILIFKNLLENYLWLFCHSCSIPECQNSERMKIKIFAYSGLQDLNMSACDCCFWGLCNLPLDSPNWSR